MLRSPALLSFPFGHIFFLAPLGFWHPFLPSPRFSPRGLVEPPDELPRRSSVDILTSLSPRQSYRPPSSAPLNRIFFSTLSAALIFLLGGLIERSFGKQFSWGRAITPLAIITAIRSGTN